MIIAFGSFIWHVVLDLIGVIIAIILAFIISDALYTLFQQYSKDEKQATFMKWITPMIHDVSRVQLEVSKLKGNQKILKQRVSNLDSKDGDDNGTKENR